MEIGIRVFFFIIIYVEWIMDSVGLLFFFNVGLLFVCIMDIELRKWNWKYELREDNIL